MQFHMKKHQSLHILRFSSIMLIAQCMGRVWHVATHTGRKENNLLAFSVGVEFPGLCRVSEIYKVVGFPLLGEIVK